MQVMLTEENSNELRSFIYQIITEEVQRARTDAGVERRVLNQTEIAQYFGVSTTTIREWETQGMPFSMMGERLKFYDKEECRVWLMSVHR
ncbi:MerR family transcriptional regulator [Enterococcus olivae]